MVKHEEEEHARVHMDFSSVQFPPDGPESEDDVLSFEVNMLHYYEPYWIFHIIIFRPIKCPC